MDEGHYATELILRETENEIKQMYLRAQIETQKKLDDYLSRFAVKDAIKREQLKKGEITQKDYARWRKGQMCIGQRWQEMVDTLTQDYVHADKIAMSIVNGHLPEAYALNHNYATFQVEKDSLVDTSYTLYDRHTVERLVRDNPDLLPQPDINVAKDERWNRTHIKNEITQGVLQGEDLRKVSKRLQRVTGMDQSAAIRNARTAMTGAQNAGRVDSYRRAQNMGIELEQEWLATLDGRTRHSHRQMDGKRAKVGEKFPNGCKYPGDPDGPPWEVYNCRCTLVAAVKGIDQSNAPRFSRLGDTSYEEWKKEHEKFEVGISTPQSQIGRATTVKEIDSFMNGQGWFQHGTANLGGCSLEGAKSIASSYQQVFEKYPQLVGKFDAPDAQPVGMGANTYAWCYIRNGGKVQVNPWHYGGWDSLVKQYESDVISGWHPAGTTAESIVIHEIGHAVDGLLAKEGVLGGVTASGEYRYASSSLKNTIMKRAAKIDPDVQTAMMWDMKWGVESSVSRYATKNPQEWFAECFAEYITSANPRVVATEFGKELEKLLRRLT